MMKRISSLLVAALVLGGLSFGAAQLRGGEATDCEALGYHGPCDASGSCYDLCLHLYPLNNGDGVCLPNDCCMCVER
jgi:hypothetical protein